MKLTQVLWKQNIQRAFKNLWFVQKTRVVYGSNSELVAKELGLDVVDAVEHLKPKQQHEAVDLSHLKPRVFFDERHPDWNDRVCLTFDNNNVLIAGIEQAQLITNTVKVADELPGKYANLIEQSPDNADRLVKRIIYTSTMFNAHQEKLPVVKDPARPAWNFPRSYGLTTERKVRGISQKLVRLCDLLAGPEVARNRYVVEDGLTHLFIECQSNLMRLALKTDLLLVSPRILSQIDDVGMHRSVEFPDIYPLNVAISLGKTNLYKQKDLYPISALAPLNNVHTLFAYHDPTEVKNLSELPVTEGQLHGRALMKAFTVAASCARQKYGRVVRDLPSPITLQCVHSNGQDFRFSVLQLNTLDLNSVNGLRNFWWSTPPVKLYTEAAYVKGIPTLSNYNPAVFKMIFAFYRNE